MSYLLFLDPPNTHGAIPPGEAASISFPPFNISSQLQASCFIEPLAAIGGDVLHYAPSFINDRQSTANVYPYT